MIRKVAVTVIAAAGLALPAQAQAAHVPSWDYCDASLKGQTGQAPDNDIGVVTNRLASQGYPPFAISYYRTWTAPQSYSRLVEYLYYSYTNRTVFRYRFECYMTPYNSYHDLEHGIVGVSNW